jgi:hypothetical protein
VDFIPGILTIVRSKSHKAQFPRNPRIQIYKTEVINLPLYVAVSLGSLALKKT